MPRTNVYINRTLCDFEQIEGLPIELNVSVDKFLSVDSRLTGTKLDGGIKQLVLPATKTNSTILSDFWEFGSTPDAMLDIIIDVDGQPVFAGKCKPTETLRSWTRPKQYFLELYGGSGDPLSQLEGVLLTDIDMGGTSTDTSTVLSSWSHNFGTSAATATFAPVMYGRPVANNPQKYYQQHEDLRPHITYTHIFNKIFESHLGYKINSTFYDSEAFRRMHYMFGVGDQWQLSTDVSSYKFEYTLTSPQLLTPPATLARIRYNTLVSDAQNMWSPTNYIFTAPVPGYYSFDITYFLTPGTSFQLYIQTMGQGVHSVIEQKFLTSLGASTYEYRVSLPEQFYSAGQTFFIRSNASNTNAESGFSSTIKGRLSQRGYIGAEIATESCLHKQPVKDFLRGVFHQFNLTGRFEVISKQFYFEPRISYFTSDSYGAGHAGSFARTEYDGYYQRPLTSSVDWSEKVQPEGITISKVYPFGDNLILSYKKAEDSTSKEVLKRSNYGVEQSQDLPPVYGVKYPMTTSATGKGNIVSENPYFYPLPNASVNEVQPGAHLPAMMPKEYKFDGPLPEPTFEFNPTCGFYYGLSSNIAWNYNGTDRTLPMMYMQPPLGGGYYVRNQDCISFNNTGDYINGQISNNKGLAENYYYNYLQCVKYGEIVEAEIKLRPDEVVSEDFTQMKYFLGHHFILIGIRNYNPLTQQAKCVFFKYAYGMTEAELDAITGSEIYNTLVFK